MVVRKIAKITAAFLVASISPQAFAVTRSHAAGLGQLVGEEPPPPKPAVKLFNSYGYDNAKTQIFSVTCGSTAGSSGCYGSAILSPFRQACALVATPLITRAEPNGSTTLSRRVAVMDRGSRGGDRVVVHIFQETITVAEPHATPQTSLLRTINLPLVGGPSATCSIASHPTGFYVGTTLSPEAIRIAGDYTLTSFSGGSPPIPLESITTLLDGHIAVTFKDTASNASGFFVLNNEGQFVMGGGGAQFLVGSGNGVNLGPNAPTVTQPAMAALNVANRRIVKNAAGAVLFDGSRTYAMPKR